MGEYSLTSRGAGADIESEGGLVIISTVYLVDERSLVQMKCSENDGLMK